MESLPPSAGERTAGERPGSPVKSYLVAAVVVALATGIGFPVRDWVTHTDLGMLLLLGVVIVAYREPLGPALLAVALSVAAFDFFFVPPFHTFDIAHAKYLLTFTVMGVVGVTISSLAAQVRQHERTLGQARLVAEAEQVRSSLLSSVSHDLRTPLASIIGSASALRDTGLDQDNRSELIATIEEEGLHLQHLLDNLLQMTRVAGAPTIQADWQVPEEIVGGALHQLESKIVDREVVVRIAPEASLGSFDALLVELALVNLIDNSIKYGAPGTAIDVTVRVDDAELLWEVGDRGPGLPAGDAQRIFEKFYRAPGHVARGSGLGLAIVKAVAVAHGGRVFCRNREGGGAEIGFALPVSTQLPALPTEEGM